MTTICTLCGRNDGHHTADNCPLKKYANGGEEVGAYLRTRVVHDCDTGCMVWQGAVCGHRRKTPSARIHSNGPAVSVRRWIWEVLHGPMKDGRRIVATCRVERCVSPNHMTPMNTSEVNRWVGKIGALRTPEARARRSAKAQNRSHLTRDDVDRARQMRKEGATFRKIADAIGAHISTAHRICTGESWFETKELKMAQDRPRYLRALFSACPDGWSTQQIAAAVGDSLEETEAMLMELWRERKAAKVPNRTGKGYVWRTALKSDSDDGFLFDPDEQPLHVLNGKWPASRKQRSFARNLQV
jgi:hypothetical protein